jgi:hypothetical protein
MPNELNELLITFEQWIAFTESLRNMKEEVWGLSIEEGKWSVKDIIIHIALWDKYFYEEAIKKVATHQPLTVIHLDYDEFNSKSMSYGRSITTDQLIEEAIEYRSNIIADIRTMSDEVIARDYLDGDGHIFNVTQYVKDFIWHDQHHVGPLKEFLSSRG